MSPEARIRAALADLGEALIELAAQSSAPASTPIELLSVADFARRAGIGRSTAYLLASSGQLRSVKVRGRRLVPSSELGRLAQAAA